MKVSIQNVLIFFTTVFFIPSTHGTHHQDRFCVRNLGCDTDIQDMVLGVSLFQNYKVLHESDYSKVSIGFSIFSYSVAS